MSQENVEIVRAFFEAWNAGEMDALCELHDTRPPRFDADSNRLAPSRTCHAGLALRLPREGGAT
jgi:hypothetical protein